MGASSAGANGARLPAILLAAALLFLPAFTSPVAAETYRSEYYHFRLDFPDGWNRADFVDEVHFQEPEGGPLARTIVVNPKYDTDARNDAAFLLTEVRGRCETLTRLYEAAYIVIPESFETRGGRPAAQCVLDLDVERDFLRHRVVQFASDYYNNTYLLEMFTERGSYINNSSVWENTVDSFSVEGEPLSRSPDALWLMGAIGLVAASAVIPLGLWVRRPRRPHSAVATAEGDEETAPQEEAPGVLPGARRGP